METGIVYLECANRKEFLELQLADRRLRVRLGLIGQPCLVLNASFKLAANARHAHQNAFATWSELEFRECSPSAQVVDGSVADELFCDGREDHPLLDTLLSMNGAQDLRGRPRRLALFRNGLRWQGDLDLERIAGLGICTGIIVDGDVEVSGVFSQLTYTYPSHVLIGGSVRAASLGHGDSQMRVLGDVRVDNIVYGEYNDGSLRIDGSVYGRAFISADHDMYAEGDYHLPVCNWDMENWTDCLHPNLFEWDKEEGCPDTMISGEAIREFMHTGRAPFCEGAAPVFRTAASTPKATPPEPSEFMLALRASAEAEDVEAIVQLLERWPVRDAEWRLAVLSRLLAPTNTPEQLARLQALHTLDG